MFIYLTLCVVFSLITLFIALIYYIIPCFRTENNLFRYFNPPVWPLTQTTAAGAVLGKCLEMKWVFVKDKFVSCSSKVITAPLTLAISQTSASVHSQVIFSVKPVSLSRETAVIVALWLTTGHSLQAGDGASERTGLAQPARCGVASCQDCHLMLPSSTCRCWESSGY